MFKPFDHGADIVMNSITKLLAGHSDVTAGYVAARDSALTDACRDAAITWGLVPSPFDCWLGERGMQSFSLRYERAAQNAAVLADRLAATSGVAKVFYPARDDHPDAEVAQRLFGQSGGTMVAFEIEGGRDAANRLVRAIPEMPFAPTLGDIATTVAHPASSSHRGLTEQARADLGIFEGTFRLSVGVEDIEPLAEGLVGAIAQAVT